MRILVINAGSSSLRYRHFDRAAGVVSLAGRMEGIGGRGGRLLHEVRDGHGNPQRQVSAHHWRDHGEALAFLVKLLAGSGAAVPDAIGHRIVHGGERFSAPAVIDDEVLAALAGLDHLAPLHNPPGIEGIRACRAQFPGVPQVAVFDTAFHHTLAPDAFRYAVSERWYRRHGVRRYGFHGLAHASLVRQAAAWLGKEVTETHLITLHLGNGASACAVAEGRSVDTSMGLTPLEGLVMGSRCGDLDPAVVFHLLRAGVVPDEIEAALNRESGLKGLCGSSDMREVIARAGAGEAVAGLALAIYCRRIRKYIGAYLALLPQVDALVFSGGVGENAAPVRAGALQGLAHLGIVLDAARNDAALNGEVMEIQHRDSALKILVMHAREEEEIARQVEACLGGRGNGRPGV